MPNPTIAREAATEERSRSAIALSGFRHGITNVLVLRPSRLQRFFRSWTAYWALRRFVNCRCLEHVIPPIPSGQP
jgi:hypothetical protein